MVVLKMKRKIIWISILILLFEAVACGYTIQTITESRMNQMIDMLTKNIWFEKGMMIEPEKETEYMLNIQVGAYLLTATLEENSSVDRLIEMLVDGPITLQMSDYGSMEKVGILPETLPRSDEQISTQAGDLILYQGNSFVIYYDTNFWNLTRLGRINDITQQELKKILGDGNVQVILSLGIK